MRQNVFKMRFPYWIKMLDSRRMYFKTFSIYRLNNWWVIFKWYFCRQCSLACGEFMNWPTCTEKWPIVININQTNKWAAQHFMINMPSQLALRRWPNVGIGRHRRDRQPTSRQRWYSVACVATVCWHSVGARRLAYRSLPMFCVWTLVVGIKCFSNKCCRSTRLSIHQLHI